MCFLLGAQPRAQTPDNNISMQRTCLPPADFKTTALPPCSSSSSRQHRARVAGPLCAMVTCFRRSLQSITRAHHHLCRCCLLCVIYSYEHNPEPRLEITTATRREHAYSQLTAKLPPCRPAATAGSTMCVWQVRAVL